MPMAPPTLAKSRHRRRLYPVTGGFARSVIRLVRFVAATPATGAFTAIGIAARHVTFDAIPGCTASDPFRHDRHHGADAGRFSGAAAFRYYSG